MNTSLQSDQFQKEYWETGINYRPPWHPVVKACVSPKLKLVMNRIPITREMRLLDVGSGNGTYAYYLLERAQCFAVDASLKLLKLNPCRKALADARNLPFRDRMFDVVLSACLLHHVPDPVSVVAELKRVSRQHVVLIEPNRSNPAVALFSLLVSSERGGLKFTRTFLKRCAEANDLRVEHLFSTGMIFPNKMPRFMVRPMKIFDGSFFLGMNTILIAHKQAAQIDND